MTRYEQTLILRTVAVMLAVITALLIWTESAHADTGLLVDEWTEGHMRYCEYDVMGDTVIITVDYADMCELSVEV